MNRYLFASICLLILSGCKSNNSESIQTESQLSLELMEINGIQSYQKGDYENALRLLKKPATWGYKGSQYTLAFMFLKGQHVPQSTLIGMGWLGVATEVETEEWSEQYRQFYAAAPVQMKSEIDSIVNEYIRRYGMKAQNITCKKGPTIHTRAVRHVCTKSDAISTVYDIDLKEEDVTIKQ